MSLLPIRRCLPLFVMLLALAFPSMASALLAFGVLSVGVTHGSFDLMSEKFSASDLILGFLAYVVCMTCFYYALEFLTAPAFTLFIILSALHFGKTEYKSSLKEESVVFPLCWGLVVLAVLVVNHQSQALQEMNRLILTRTQLPFVELHPLARNLVNLVLFSCLATLCYLKGALKKMEILTAVLLFALLSQFSLWISAGIFFVCWHSIDAMGSELKNWEANKKQILFFIILIALPAVAMTCFFHATLEFSTGMAAGRLARIACAIAGTHAMFQLLCWSEIAVFFRARFRSPVEHQTEERFR